MPLRYFDVAGNEISLSRWQALVRDPDYGYKVESDRKGAFHLEVSWLGVCLSDETAETARLWCVKVYRIDEAFNRAADREVRCEFHHTMKDALARGRQFIRQVTETSRAIDEEE